MIKLINRDLKYIFTKAKKLFFDLFFANSAKSILYPN